MPFNICDAGGNHIGFIHRQYPETIIFFWSPLQNLRRMIP